ncbi:MAG: polysaccharide deacetylase family protein [Gemmatimonadota bacterium]|nr:polysaccharide deacetylase family protein [Gemmatimonadota bacterium]
MSLRAGVKNLAERGLTGLGAAAIARRVNRDRTVVLAYHNVIPRGEKPAGDRSLHIGQEAFGEHLDRLVETHQIVDLASVDRHPPGQGRPCAVITFDDAYAGAVEAGVDELVRRGLPATIFVVPGMLDRRSFWWDRLADPDMGVVPPAIRRTALAEHAGRDLDVSRWTREAGLREVEPPEYALSATKAELEAAASRPGISLGSHTWSHVNLAAIPTDEADHEIARAAAWLRATGRAESWISYPYGLANEGARAAAARRHAGGLEIRGGLAARGTLTGSYSVPRVNVPAGLSRAGLELRASGVVGTR